MIFQQCTEFPFTEYLAGFWRGSNFLLSDSCQWINVGTKYPGSVEIINSKEEFEKYITCKKDIYGNCVVPCVDYPFIDFSQYTLLLASDSRIPYYAIPIFKELLQCSPTKYVLNIRLQNNSLVEATTRWCVALLVSKLDDVSEIEWYIYFNRSRSQ